MLAAVWRLGVVLRRPPAPTSAPHCLHQTWGLQPSGCDRHRRPRAEIDDRPRTRRQGRSRSAERPGPNL